MFKTSKFAFFALAVCGAAALIGAQRLSAQQEEQRAPVAQLRGYYVHEPWTGGTHADAAFQAAAGSTIPMSTYSFAATKGSSTRTGTIVGTSPFVTPAGTTISAVLIPLKITIGTTVFDPTAANTCDGSVSTVTRFSQSPLVQNVTNLTINGVNVGTTQFINGFRRAEFWSKIGGSSAYQNPISFTAAAVQSVTTTGSLYSTGCTQLGIVGYNWMSSTLGSLMTSLTNSGVLSPSKVAIFLVKNVVQSTANPPSTSGCCILGFHGAKGSPVQTYMVTDWDTTGDFSGTADGSIAAHELGEWMDDPLGTNPTPAWGGIGQVGGCQTNWEVGDPLSGTLMPAITLSGKAYHMQELAFFSWFFNNSGVASLGTGGKFSSNGKFSGPSKVCPPGGTW